MSCGIGQTENDVLDLVVNSTTRLESIGLRVRREIMEVRLEEPESLHVANIQLVKIYPHAPLYSQLYS